MIIWLNFYEHDMVNTAFYKCFLKVFNNQICLNCSAEFRIFVNASAPARTTEQSAKRCHYLPTVQIDYFYWRKSRMGRKMIKIGAYLCQ